MGEDERNDDLFMMDEKGGSHEIIVDDLVDAINIVAQPEKYPEYYGGEITFDTDVIKDTFAYRLLFGKEFQNNWRKLHGLPMRRRKWLRH